MRLELSPGYVSYSGMNTSPGHLCLRSVQIIMVTRAFVSITSLLILCFRCTILDVDLLTSLGIFRSSESLPASHTAVVLSLSLTNSDYDNHELTRFNSFIPELHDVYYGFYFPPHILMSDGKRVHLRKPRHSINETNDKDSSGFEYVDDFISAYGSRVSSSLASNIRFLLHEVLEVKSSEDLSVTNPEMCYRFGK